MTPRHRRLAGPALLLLPLGLVGCATIMQGSTQKVAISSAPTGAQVYVNGNQRGLTPMVADLSRKDIHVIALRLDGYQPYEVALARSVSGWVVGNILFGGLIGLAVDASSGGMYKLTPDQVTATMGPGAALLEGSRDVLTVAVVLRSDPTWEKIGQLIRE
jgi:hypothetical protein